MKDTSSEARNHARLAMASGRQITGPDMRVTGPGHRLAQPVLLTVHRDMPMLRRSFWSVARGDVKAKEHKEKRRGTGREDPLSRRSVSLRVESSAASYWLPQVDPGAQLAHCWTQSL